MTERARGLFAGCLYGSGITMLSVWTDAWVWIIGGLYVLGGACVYAVRS